jgi:hypothetical protein
MSRKPLAASAAALLLVGLAHGADACSRILWNDNKLAVVVGRTFLPRFVCRRLTPAADGSDTG